MRVYALLHEYDIGGEEIRGLFARKADAEASLASVTSRGKPSKAPYAHTRRCCEVATFDVFREPQRDVLDDPKPIPPPPDLRKPIIDALVRDLEGKSWPEIIRALSERTAP